MSTGPMGTGPMGTDQPLRRPRGRDRVTTPEPVPPPAPSPSTGAIRGLLGPVTGSLKIRRADGDVQSLRVDWPQCKGHGLCAEVAPEIIQLDEWGFPLIERRSLTADELSMARKATQVCPTLALRLVGPPAG